ncbi:hypothetical protein E3J39_02730 [Candidatus Bathyarchaeota archaeon]|nr:MAG: hypothetical protein E3J39_02730 [Candidatus Bathyarchaeota archaeon]
MAENYRFVRFTWLERRDLEALGREMSDFFDVKTLLVPTDDWDIIPSPFEREGLRVRADTLTARLAPMRATIFQRENAPFTERDMELRRRILEIYPRDRGSPFALGVTDEPKFDIEE